MLLDYTGTTPDWDHCFDLLCEETEFPGVDGYWTGMISIGVFRGDWETFIVPVDSYTFTEVETDETRTFTKDEVCAAIKADKGFTRYILGAIEHNVRYTEGW